MPNIFAYVMLIAWPIFSILFYRRFDTITATFCTIVGGYLLLPVRVEIDLPLVPALDQNTIPAIAAILCCRFIKNININLIPSSGAERWIVILLLLLPLVTILTNSEPVFNGVVWKTGLTIYDSISAIILAYLKILPFIVAGHIIKNHEDLTLLIKLIIISGLFYSILVLFEIRMSPKLHTWIYGFFPHSWGQQARFGGFRAIVFMGHGLLVSMFLAVCLAAAVINFKNKIRTFYIPPILIVIYFLIVLILNKSVGSVIFGSLLVLCIALLPIYLIKRITQLIISLVILYPLLSMFGLFPHFEIIEFANEMSPQRAQSLEFRFFHEMKLLEHAQEKLFFGWGAWGRNRLADSVTDGYWIIALSSYGIIGFSLLFGLAVVSIQKSIKASTLISNKSQQLSIVSFALLLSIIMLDQIPNSSLHSWSWFLIGALIGRSNYIFEQGKRPKFNHKVAC